MKKVKDINAAKEFVRERANLFDIISEDIGDQEWKDEGTNTQVTCSPFRDESNPSFKVSIDKFKDWGGEQHGGDVFTWIQLWHGLRKAYEPCRTYALCGQVSVRIGAHGWLDHGIQQRF